jgi:predicted component of type VI protein secretion system
MVQFRILSGPQAGTQWVARRFPVRVGRADANDLQLEEDGVWDRHFEVDFDRADGFVLKAQPNAIVSVNQQPVQTTRLRNGDSIEIGSVRLQFWLGEVRQRGLRPREWFVWALIATVSLGEVALVYWLLR